mmetsp:Transcript_9519/g.22436  ORF Transcript_9519/g.22436 Transcript_9519/m.22436 type:complete len:203 (+) Transcript_9519:111-719(+)
MYPVCRHGNEDGSSLGPSQSPGGMSHSLVAQGRVLPAPSADTPRAFNEGTERRFQPRRPIIGLQLRSRLPHRSVALVANLQRRHILVLRRLPHPRPRRQRMRIDVPPVPAPPPPHAQSALCRMHRPPRNADPADRSYLQLHPVRCHVQHHSAHAQDAPPAHHRRSRPERCRMPATAHQPEREFPRRIHLRLVGSPRPLRSRD